MRFPRITVLVMTLLMMTFLSCQILAADHSIPVKGGVSVMEHSQSSNGDLTFHVEVGRIEAVDVQTKAGNFTRLIIPGYHVSHEVGLPELPKMNRLINGMGAADPAAVRPLGHP